MYNKTMTFLLLLAASACYVPAASADQPTTDKTLVAWVTLDNLTQRGGSALTVQVGEEFDAIVFGERAPGKWMAGSHGFQRTEGNQEKNPVETADAQTLVQMAVVYRGDTVAIYRNGEHITEYRTKNIDLLGKDDDVVVFGARHLGQRDNSRLAGAIDDARIYAKALTPDQIKALRPNQPSDIEPYAWWDFEGEEVVDRTGRFKHSKLAAGAKLADGRLVLAADALLVCARTEALANLADQPGALPPVPYTEETPAWPKNPPDNWVTFHLAHPGPGDAMPGDPNCAFFYKGKYHLHYIYRNRWGFCFAHLSSTDMVRWKWHPTTLAPPFTGHGMFSGTGFFTKEGQPAIIYHGQGSGRNQLAFALDDNLEQWTKPQPVIVKTESGEEPPMRHWDPDCWLKDGAYYGLSGGGNPPVFKSADLEEWRYLGPLFHADTPWDKLGVTRDTDVSCANMFKIGDKWMLLCICHTIGCRYYLGDFKDEKYLPEFHARMSWGGNQFFAPESLLTPDGRRVMWAWLRNVPVQPSGIQCLPRELELPEDGVLRIRPLRELQALRQDERNWGPVRVRPEAPFQLDELAGDALEVEVTFAAPLPEAFGIELLADEQGKEGMVIAAGAGKKTLQVGHIQPPFELKDGEDLTLRVFIDKNLVEVFANDRQAALVGHKHVRVNPNLRLFSTGGDLTARAKAWKMKAIYPSPQDLTAE